MTQPTQPNETKPAEVLIILRQGVIEHVRTLNAAEVVVLELYEGATFPLVTEMASSQTSVTEIAEMVAAAKTAAEYEKEQKEKEEQDGKEKQTEEGAQGSEEKAAEACEEGESQNHCGNCHD